MKMLENKIKNIKLLNIEDELQIYINQIRE